MELENCWFVLPQTACPPSPTIPKSISAPSIGQLTFGHLIPGLKDVLEVLNAEGPSPDATPIIDECVWDLEWDNNEEPPTGAAFNTRHMREAFKSTVKNFRYYRRLSAKVHYPTVEYVLENLRSEGMSRHGRSWSKFGLESWSVFMVCGLIIAQIHSTEPLYALGRGDGVVPGEVLARDGNASDFVWAVRLMKVSKRFWSSSPVFSCPRPPWPLKRTDTAPPGVNRRMVGTGTVPELDRAEKKAKNRLRATLGNEWGAVKDAYMLGGEEMSSGWLMFLFL
ncbi:hypothetical protein DER44DRAFT_800511 [Fusarium oxysporum]|nr:hypothetical protein DER44DRAFT_800511 [Fusarium oxysporum]